VNIKKIDTFTPNLQPSIETYFHAVLPQKFVVHLHHLPTLTMLIKKNCKNYIKSRDDGNFNWIFIEYFKPGFELAKNIDNKLKTGYTPDVIFLQNHGIIFAAEKIENLEKIFNWICNRFGRNIHFNENLIVSNSNNKNVFNFGNRNYDLSVLLTKSDNFTRLKNNWRICPDHIVFLGKDPNIILNNPKKNEKPIHAPFTFDSINNLIIQHNPSVSEIMQLCAYIEVISGLKRNDIVSNLTQAHCEELINWDLEKLRKASNMSTRI
jgi:rhamnose utilization protein RhaD (predicted bifunctional aldolase and dehydrogenase)